MKIDEAFRDGSVRRIWQGTCSPDTELGAFHRGCMELAADPEVFKVMVREDVPMFGTMRRHVLLLRGAVSRAYEASWGSELVTPALQDVQAGVYAMGGRNAGLERSVVFG
jgi:hypothetical protein